MTVVLRSALLASVLCTLTTLKASADVSENVQAIAEQAGVDPIDLQGAVNETGYDPATYLCLVGEGACPLNQAIERRLDCIQWHESHGDPGATNPRSKAAGLFQFLASTWRGTPQGQAGLSPYDPPAARSAARWMINQGRVREWEVVTRGLC